MLLSLIYKIIVFNIMLVVLNVCPGPPITLNWEQGCLNLSDSPAKREQIIFLPPTFLYRCWCISDMMWYRHTVPPGQRNPHGTKLVCVCASLAGGTRVPEASCVSMVVDVFRGRLQCRLWCACCASRAAGAAVVPRGVIQPPPPTTAELSLPWCLLHSLFLQPP